LSAYLDENCARLNLGFRRISIRQDQRMTNDWSFTTLRHDKTIRIQECYSHHWSFWNKLRTMNSTCLDCWLAWERQTVFEDVSRDWSNFYFSFRQPYSVISSTKSFDISAHGHWKLDINAAFSIFWPWLHEMIPS
jgi:hypothetical protein